MGDYIGTTLGVIKGDTRSLDNGSCGLVVDYKATVPRDVAALTSNKRKDRRPLNPEPRTITYKSQSFSLKPESLVTQGPTMDLFGQYDLLRRHELRRF